MIQRIHRLQFAVFLIFSSSFSALACPELLRRNPDLCDISDRYESAKIQLKELGIQEPDRMADVLAPRFINFPTWQREKDKFQFSPWHVYSPAPSTWQGWENGNALLEKSIEINLQNESIRPLSLEVVKAFHKSALKDLNELAGGFRKNGEHGVVISKKWALNRQQREQILKGAGYFSLTQKDQPLISWTAAVCNEHITEEIKRTHMFRYFGYLIPETQFFVDEAGVERQCGFMNYPPHEDVPAEMANWASSVNLQLQSWAETGSPSLVEIAAHAQRKMIAIHPFRDGNGRTSRFVMDYILMSMNLPAPILADMDNDLYLDEKAWTQEVHEGLERSLETFEKCAQDSSQKNCRGVSRSVEIKAVQEKIK